MTETVDPAVSRDIIGDLQVEAARLRGQLILARDELESARSEVARLQADHAAAWGRIPPEHTRDDESLGDAIDRVVAERDALAVNCTSAEEAVGAAWEALPDDVTHTDTLADAIAELVVRAEASHVDGRSEGHRDAVGVLRRIEWQMSDQGDAPDLRTIVTALEIMWGK